MLRSVFSQYKDMHVVDLKVVFLLKKAEKSGNAYLEDNQLFAFFFYWKTLN